MYVVYEWTDGAISELLFFGAISELLFFINQMNEILRKFCSFGPRPGGCGMHTIRREFHSGGHAIFVDAAGICLVQA